MPDRFIEADSDRRTFIKRGLLAGGSLALAGRRRARGGAGQAHRAGRVARHGAARRSPNILVILVDQLRAPAWAPASLALDALLPNLASLRSESVSFEGHYTASNDCSPSRGALLTGLYSHQTGCMITGRSKLSTGFPTWGTLLRELDYETTWWGKWHLNPDARASLQPYGFSGGTYPSPNGAPGQGTEVDPTIVDQFEDWFDHESGNGPWCTTVSLVNPHDVAWWYRFTSEIPPESEPPAWVSEIPPNFETPEQLLSGGKPLLHRSLQETAARSFGAVPFDGPEMVGAWSGLMNTYLLLQTYVDRQIGRVLAKLAGRPEVSANTVIVFTSDHGEYGGAHGMRGKGASAYEEAIHVPLYVSDPRGLATAATGVAPQPAHLERRRRPAAAEHRDRVERVARGELAAAPRRARRPRRDLRRRAGARPALGAARHRRGRDRVRRATCTTPKRPATWWRCAPNRASWGCIRTGARKASRPKRPGRKSSATTTARTLARRSSQTSPDRARWRNELRATLEEEAIPNELHEPLPGYLEKPQGKGMSNYYDVDESEDEKAAASHLHVAAPIEPTPD